MRPERANFSASALVITGILGTATSMSSAHNFSSAVASPCSWASLDRFEPPEHRHHELTEQHRAVPTNKVATNPTNKLRKRDFMGFPPASDKLANFSTDNTILAILNPARTPVHANAALISTYHAASAPT